MAKKLYDTAKEQETAILVSVPSKTQAEEKTHEYLEELAFLTETVGAVAVKRFVQRLEKPDIRTFVGKGKLEEIKAFTKEFNIDMVIFDDDLSPSQVRNLERELEIKIVDRSLLILDIFAIRAKTAQARMQVEMAQYQYFLPRLTNLWTHLSRQKGGVGMRGPGETEIETDRRIVREKIALLRDKLEKLDKQNYQQRKSRTEMVRVALVGYTNVGKSTLMNLLSKSDVFAENKLFATVDATVRKLVIDQIPFLLSDTVGFIRKLPTRLIESFKSTLDEIREADLLVHVVDISHPSFEEHIDVVNNTLKDIKSGDKPVLLVFNKIDQYRVQELDETNDMGEGSEKPTLAEMKATYMAQMHAPTIFISAKDKTNIDQLREELMRRVAAIHFERYPNNNNNNNNN
jgi:GTP-binding protein HflX